MRKLFTVLFLFVLICAVSFAQTKQVEYYINGIDLGKGEILKFGTDKDKTLAKVYDIITDLSDRRGLRQEWENIDGGIQDEIIEKWKNIIDKK